MNKNEHKRDKYVKLHPDYDENHIYLINGKSHIELGYESVTTFMEQFFEKFDADKIIDKYYNNWQKRKHKKYFKLSKEEIINLWKDNGKKARDKGLIVHKIFEDYVNENEVNKELDETLNFINWYELEVSKPFRTEYTVYGEKERIIGNIDFIYYNKKDELCMVDYKCTDVPNNYQFLNMCEKIDMPDTKKSKHTVQLNLYKYLLEKYYDLKIKYIYNLYIKDNNWEFVKQDIINVNNMFNKNENSTKFNGGKKI